MTHQQLQQAIIKILHDNEQYLVEGYGNKGIWPENYEVVAFEIIDLLKANSQHLGDSFVQGKCYLEINFLK